MSVCEAENRSHLFEGFTVLHMERMLDEICHVVFV